MPGCSAPGAEIHYQDLGRGPAVLCLHGFSETGDYWRVGGFAELLAGRFRLILIDMRGHGRTRACSPQPGFDVQTMASDLERVADHLGLQAFHVLAHATGSVVALRYAMRAPPRLRSLVVTSAASATAMASADPEENAAFFARMADFYRRHEWTDILPRLRRNPRPFLHGIEAHAERDRLWDAIDEVFRQCDPVELGRFAASFYDDPDPRLEDLGSICAPTLVVRAELDEMMEAPSRLLLRHIRKVQDAYIPAVGHMTALESPAVLARIVGNWLAEQPPAA